MNMNTTASSISDLEVEEVPETGTRPRPVGIAKRAMAGLQSLKDRSQLGFRIVEETITEPTSYGDWDRILVVETVGETIGGGRNTILRFQVVLHTSATGRQGLNPWYLAGRHQDPITLWVTGSDGEESCFEGDLAGTAFAEVAREVMEELRKRFIMALAFAALDMEGSNVGWEIGNIAESEPGEVS